ncbi:MAG: hypothetical protein JXJ04_14245 [Spirochaetales bacterium]|nr:hypothetical protein [Spirochaetales bacterium]
MDDKYIISTKFYFIDPVDMLNSVIDGLIRFEFETYIVQGENKTKLFNLLDVRSQHVIFISLKNRAEALNWLEESSVIARENNVSIRLAAFVYNNMNEDLKDDFKKNGIEIIPFSKITENTFGAIQKIIRLFNAKNRRKYIRAKAQGTCLALLQKRDDDLTLRAEIVDISTHAFSCKIDPKDEGFLQHKLYRDVFLSLKGMQLQVSARLVGYRDEGMARIYVFSICGDGSDSFQSNASQKIPTFISKRIFSFIKGFLLTHLRQRFSLLSEG